jgi:molybdopterin-binding protein
LKISARNQLAGVVRKITSGPINSEVVIELAEGLDLVAVVTRESAQNLELQEGKKVHAIVKASNVIVGVE